MRIRSSPHVGASLSSVLRAAVCNQERATSPIVVTTPSRAGALVCVPSRALALSWFLCCCCRVHCDLAAASSLTSTSPSYARVQASDNSLGASSALATVVNEMRPACGISSDLTSSPAADLRTSGAPSVLASSSTHSLYIRDRMAHGGSHSAVDADTSGEWCSVKLRGPLTLSPWYGMPLWFARAFVPPCARPC